MSFPIHDVDSAPEAAKPILSGTKKSFGFIPTSSAPWPRRRRC